MNTQDEVLAIVRGLSAADLDLWVGEGLVAPSRKHGQIMFDEVDVARLRLIVEFEQDLGIEKTSIPAMLSLLDQLNTVRRDFRLLVAAVEKQKSSIKDEIFSAVIDSQPDQLGSNFSETNIDQ